jgi:ABC-type uncharacterized transport system auxiliary subunit
MTTRSTSRLVPLLLLLAPLAGCFGHRSGVPTIATFGLDYPPPAPAARTVPAVLRVVPFGIDALYDRLGFVYRDSTHALGVDHYNRWLVSPAALVTDLIARDLAAAHLFEAVLLAPSALPTTYELSGQIEVLEEDGRSQCRARLRLRALFVHVPDAGGRRVVFEQAFDADEPCATATPAGFAAAMSRAVEQISQQLQQRIAAATAPQ